jgi:hypothetical protein
VEVAFEIVCRGREARPGFRGQVQPHYWNIPVDKFANGMMVFSRRIDQEERWALPGSRGKNGGRRNVGGTVACQLPSRSSPSGSIPGRGGGGEGAQAGDVLVLGIQGAVEIGIEG